MQKTFKKLLVLLLSAAMVVCLVALAACNDNDAYKEEDGKIVITVLYPDGTPVNGQTDGDQWNNDLGQNVNVCLQWCTADQCCNNPVILDENGKAKLDIQNDIIAQLGGASKVSADTEIEFHVMGVENGSKAKGYLSDGEYGTFTRDTFPKSLTITLKAA